MTLTYVTCTKQNQTTWGDLDRVYVDTVFLIVQCLCFRNHLTHAIKLVQTGNTPINQRTSTIRVYHGAICRPWHSGCIHTSVSVGMDVRFIPTANCFVLCLNFAFAKFDDKQQNNLRIVTYGVNSPEEQWSCAYTHTVHLVSGMKCIERYAVITPMQCMQSTIHFPPGINWGERTLHFLLGITGAKLPYTLSFGRSGTKTTFYKCKVQIQIATELYFVCVNTFLHSTTKLRSEKIRHNFCLQTMCVNLFSFHSGSRSGTTEWWFVGTSELRNGRKCNFEREKRVWIKYTIQNTNPSSLKVLFQWDSSTDPTVILIFNRLILDSFQFIWSSIEC